MRGGVSADLENSPARPRGRPSLYESSHRERVLTLAAQGCGKTEIAAELGISRQTLNAWIKAHPDFREAMSRAKDLEYAWWLKKGREGLMEAWNAASWALQMRNRFGQLFLQRPNAAPHRPEEPKDSMNAEKLRDDIERKLSRIADAGAPEEVPGKSDTSGA